MVCLQIPCKIIVPQMRLTSYPRWKTTELRFEIVYTAERRWLWQQWKLHDGRHHFMVGIKNCISTYTSGKVVRACELATVAPPRHQMYECKGYLQSLTLVCHDSLIYALRKPKGKTVTTARFFWCQQPSHIGIARSQSRWPEQLDGATYGA